MSVETRNAVYAAADNSVVNCEYNHPELGWIEFTTMSGDATTADVWASVQAGSIGAYAPATPTAADVRAEGQRRLELIGSTFLEGERETFNTQEAEATAWTADNTASTPMIDAMIAQSGDAKADLVGRILANAAALKVASGAIIGAQTAILAMDPVPTDYDDDSRWP